MVKIVFPSSDGLVLLLRSRQAAAGSKVGSATVLGVNSEERNQALDSLACTGWTHCWGIGGLPNKPFEPCSAGVTLIFEKWHLQDRLRPRLQANQAMLGTATRHEQRANCHSL